ncbi:helix-turn-helix transcriptional regulator [Atlantibacter subterraneus]|uniref:helix-turn-helix transcriptional regulator n=1 Tax=Atlantibacter subterraneus TaxID=255519 RepID=UPI00289D399C|nr:helix-turn-helix transcriptional regulator [Atlantibacter subterranea]
MKSSLTKRELQICYLSINGLSCKEISRELNISIYTVYKHRVGFLNKLRKRNMAQVRLYLKSRNSNYNNAVFSFLTKREIDISLLLISGNTYKEIAKKMAIQPSTVAKHREHIYQKLDVHGIIELSKVLYKTD